MSANLSMLMASASNVPALRSKILMNFMPARDMTVSEWAEENFKLETGTLRLIQFQREIMDVHADDSVEYVTWMKSARVGATMSMIILTCYFTSQDRRHSIVLQPTSDDASGWSSDELTPALFRCPETAKVMALSSRNTITHKVFPGGSIKILAAKSPRNLRRHSCSILMMDEVDGYETSVEGDPIALAIRRTQNSARRKIFMGSTPTNQETSKVYRSFLDSDQRYFFVPCPHCGTHQTLSWDNMHVDGEPVTSKNLRDFPGGYSPVATYKCKDCSEQINEEHKNWMIENGEWRATAPFRGHAGFFINALYSTFTNASWQKLVIEYLRAKRSPDTLQTFVNTALGLPWSDNIDNLSEEAVSKRTSRGNLQLVPSEVLLITTGVDIQKDRAEITYLGHGDERTHVLGHRKVYGDPTSDAFWEKIDAALLERFPHELGGEIGISSSAIDSGNWTQSVYRFCAGKQARGVYAIKGTPGPRPVWTESKIRPGEGAKLYNVGVDSAKTIVMQRLGVGDPESPGYVSFCEGMEFEYFEQLLSEYRKVEYVGGKPKFVWERKEGRRAEALDCFVYALAAFATESPNWAHLKAQLTPAEEGEGKKDDKGFGGLGALMANL